MFAGVPPQHLEHACDGERVVVVHQRLNCGLRLDIGNVRHHRQRRQRANIVGRVACESKARR